MHNDDEILPHISIATEKNYFGNSNWGYNFIYDWDKFNLTKQDILNNDTIVSKNLNTKVTGHNIYGYGNLFYHFNKAHKFTNLDMILGTSLGVGYLNLKGNYQITKTDDEEFGEVKDIKVNNIGVGMGLLFTLSYENHSFIFQYYMTDTTDSKYEYIKSTNQFIYQYKFSL